MTLATVIRDVYTVDERKDLRDALRTLLPAFAQHNGFAGTSAKGNKCAKIEAWFAEHPRLGYSIIAQSAAVVLLEDVGFGLDNPAGIVAIGEGQLLEAYRKHHGFHPPWNSIGGSVRGAGWAGPNTTAYFALLTGRSDSLLVARRTIRQLAARAKNRQSRRRSKLVQLHRMRTFTRSDHRPSPDPWLWR